MGKHHYKDHEKYYADNHYQVLKQIHFYRIFKKKNFIKNNLKKNPSNTECAFRLPPRVHANACLSIFTFNYCD